MTSTASQLTPSTPYSTGNLTVDFMKHTNISGVIINPNWNHHILTEKGKPHRLAIMLYAEIVHWYQPTPVIDANGELIGYKTKFHADLLQLSYSQLADKYNETKQTITRAIVRLEELGLIKRVFRTIIIKGKKCSNVLYISLTYSKLNEITKKAKGSKIIPIPPTTSTTTPHTPESRTMLKNDENGLITNDETNTSNTNSTVDKTVNDTERIDIIKKSLNGTPAGSTHAHIINIIYVMTRNIEKSDLKNYMNGVVARAIYNNNNIKTNFERYILGIIKNDIKENKVTNIINIARHNEKKAFKTYNKRSNSAKLCRFRDDEPGTYDGIPIEELEKMLLRG